MPPPAAPRPRLVVQDKKTSSRATILATLVDAESVIVLEATLKIAALPLIQVWLYGPPLTLLQVLAVDHVPAPFQNIAITAVGTTSPVDNWVDVK